MSARMASSSSPTASAKSERSASSTSTRSSSNSNGDGSASAANGFDVAAVSDRVWARAIHAVMEQKLSLRSVARLYGLHHMALYRRVRARQSVQQSQQAHHRLNVDVSAANASVVNGSSATMNGSGATMNGNGYGHMAAATERFEPPAWLPERLSDLDSVRLGAEQNDEVMALLYEEYGPSIVRHRRGDGSTGEEYCFDDDDIREVVRFIVSRDARRELPVQFPTQRWLTAFKHENGLVDGISPYQEDKFHQQFQYSTTLNSHERNERQQSAQATNWGYAERSSPRRGQTTPSMRQRQSPRENANDRDQYYSTSESESNDSSPRQRSSMSTTEQQQQEQQSRTDGKANGEGKMYRQSNTVPAEVWDRAMEDVLIHGMSLRSAAKAHGVHFAALHRRLKKRSLQKESMPFDPRYIPFEDEAGLIRVINARADLGVLMSYQEVVDLLRRATLNHRSELADEDAAELIRKFRSRVEASIRHLVKDWPLPSVDALYQQLGPVSSSSATDGSSMTSTSTSSSSSVSPRVMLPPAFSLRSNSGGPALSALFSPREWNSNGRADNANGLGRPRPFTGMSARSPNNGTGASSPQHPSQSTILRL